MLYQKEYSKFYRKLNISSNAIGDSNDKTSFLHRSLLNNTLVWRLCKAFENNSSANIKLSKTQLHEIGG